MPRKRIYMISAILCLLLTGCSGNLFRNRSSSGLPETSVPGSRQESVSSETPEEKGNNRSSDILEDAKEEEQPEADTEGSATITEESDASEPPQDNRSSDTPDEITALLDEIITPSMSEYEKVRAIHDYLVIHVDYDYDNLAAGTLPDTAYTAEGALFLHSAVCEGYAKAFSLLCDRSGVENTLVYGTADDGTGVESHAWNQVQVDGEWYNIDVTWDDPLMNGEQVTDGSNLIYDYFLVPDLTLLGNHTARSGSTIQACTSERYLEDNRRLTIASYLAEPCVFATSDEEIRTAVEQYLADGIRTFQIVCDVTSYSPEGRAELTLNQVKAAMEARMEAGQISVETQYGIADYAIIDVTITP